MLKIFKSRGYQGRRRNTSRGSVMVEMSLIGVVFFVLVIGILDFGQFLFVQHAIVERARAAARWGVVNGATNTTAIRNMVLYYQPTAPDDTKTGSFGLTTDMIHVSTPDAGTDDYRLVLQVSGYSYTVLSPFLAGSYHGAPITVSMPLGAYY